MDWAGSSALPDAAQPPRPPRPSLSICCHHSDDPKAAAWTLDVRKEIAIHVAIRHSVTFLMTCLMLLGCCSGNVPPSAASALRRSPDICRWQLFRLVTGGRPVGDALSSHITFRFAPSGRTARIRQCPLDREIPKDRTTDAPWRIPTDICPRHAEAC